MNHPARCSCFLCSLLLFSHASVASGETPLLRRPMVEHDLHEGHAHHLLQSADGASYLDFNLTGTFAVGTSTGDPAVLEPGGHDPHRRGFNLQGIELSLSGTVDPYFRARATFLLGMETDSDVFLEIEEAWMETTSLPWDLTVRAGQYLTQFGVFNPTHLHDWAFVDTPIVNARLLGEDGLRGPGAQLAWQVPLPIYSEFYFSAQNALDHHDHAHGEGEGEEHGHSHGEGGPQFSDLFLSTRWMLSVKPAPSQILTGGLSAAWGTNEFDRNTLILGGDLTWSWKLSGSTSLKWQTEAMVRRTEAVIENIDHAHHEEEHHHEEEDHHHEDHHDEEEHQASHRSKRTFTDWGVYSQLVCGFTERWTAGFRSEYSKGFERFEEPTRWRLSPAITFTPSECAQLRLQYNYDNFPAAGITDHSIWMQVQFTLGTIGSHAGHSH